MKRLILLGGLLAVVVLTYWAWRWSEVPVRSPTAAVAGVPQRIASLTLATDEILAELVPADHVVCVTYLADDPEISNVARFYPSNVRRLRDTAPEQVLALRPDLVLIAPYNSADFVKVIERSGLAVHRNEAYSSMDRIELAILAIGQRIGAGDRARELVDRMKSRRRGLADRLKAVSTRPRVLYWSAGYTAGRGSSIDDVIREAGGINVCAQRELEGAAPISPEQVLASDPDFVLVCQWAADERANRIENDPALGRLPAVRAGRVIRLEGRYLTTISQHIVEGAERLARRLHPACFDLEAERAP